MAPPNADRSKVGSAPIDAAGASLAGASEAGASDGASTLGATDASVLDAADGELLPLLQAAAISPVATARAARRET
jgi:hypothetical protein